MSTYIIGSDEVLKGDTFGGIVVCAARFSKEEEQDLHNMGVRDSKKIAPAKLKRIAQELLERYPNRFSICELEPREYNTEIEGANLTRLMDKLHEAAAKELRAPGDVHIVDLYPGCKAGDTQVKGAESEYVAVAAASIVARARAMTQFDKLSQVAGFTLPLGSTHVTEALKRLMREGRDLAEFAKLHFKNVQRILNED